MSSRVLITIGVIFVLFILGCSTTEEVSQTPATPTPPAIDAESTGPESLASGSSVDEHPQGPEPYIGRLDPPQIDISLPPPTPPAERQTASVVETQTPEVSLRKVSPPTPDAGGSVSENGLAPPDLRLLVSHSDAYTDQLPVETEPAAAQASGSTEQVVTGEPQKDTDRPVTRHPPEDPAPPPVADAPPAADPLPTIATPRAADVPETNPEVTADATDGIGPVPNRISELPSAPVRTPDNIVTREDSDYSTVASRTEDPVRLNVVPPFASERAGEDTNGALPGELERSTAPLPRETEGTQAVSVGERFEVRLPGRTWLFLGAGDRVEFMGRSVATDPQETVFAFRAVEESVLPFESQDINTGERVRHEESVLITGSPERVAMNAPVERRNTDDAAQGQSTDLAIDSIIQYIQNGSEYDEQLHQEIMTLVTGESERSADTIDQFTELPSETWISYSDRIAQTGQASAAQELLQHLWDSPAFGDDAYLYYLARSYDVNPEARDLRKARTLYQQLVDEFPFSEYYETSDDRIRYLERHFFYIR